jgi:hypothetical protein
MTQTRTATRAQATPVRHVASNNRVTRIGYAAKITWSDGAVEVCEHSHRTPDNARPCAARIVRAG